MKIHRKKTLLVSTAIMGAIILFNQGIAHAQNQNGGDDTRVRNLNGSSSTPYMPPPVPAPARISVSVPESRPAPENSEQTNRPASTSPYAPVNAIPARQGTDTPVNAIPAGQGAGGQPTNLVVAPTPSREYLKPSPIQTANTPPLVSFNMPETTTPAATRQPVFSSSGKNAPNTFNSGLAPNITDEDLDKELQESTGPSLPDATLGSHYQDGLIDGNLIRQTEILKKKNDLDEAFLTSLQNKNKIKAEILKYRNPTPVEPEKTTENTVPSGQPEIPKINPFMPPSEGTGNMISPAQNAQEQPLKTDEKKKDKKEENLLPVWFQIRGPENNYEAGILIPYDGQHYVKKNTKLPGGMTVTDIEPHSVTIRLKNGKKTNLKYGTAVPGF